MSTSNTVLSARRFPWALGGLALVRVWIQYCIYDLSFQSDIGILSVLSIAVRLLTIAVLVIMLMRMGESRRFLGVLYWGSLLCMTAGSILLFLSDTLNMSAVNQLAYVLGGIGVAWGGGMWVRLFRRLSRRDAFVASVLCVAVGALVILVLGLLPEIVTSVISVFLPMLIFILYSVAETQVPAQSTTACTPQSGFPVVHFAGLVLLAITVGVARGYPNGSFVEVGRNSQVLHEIVASGISLGFAALARKVPVQRCIAGYWGAACLAALIGIAFLALSPTNREMGVTAVLIANSFLLGIAWFSGCDTALGGLRSPYTHMGIWYGSYLLADIAGRTLTLMAGPIIGEETIITMTLVLVFSLASAALVNGLIQNQNRAQRTLQTPANMAGPHSPTQNQAAGAAKHLSTTASEELRRYGLSERELQIACLCAEGWTRKAIAEKTCLSENTVRNHIRSIYQKLGVHTKDEFMELVK